MKIGITLRVTNAPNYSEKRDALSHDWPVFLEQLGIWPIFIPNNLSNIELFLDQMNVEGLILSGGDNIGDNPERDYTEKKIIEYGIKQNIPIFGVCRGMQVINKYFNGNIKKLNNLSHVDKFHLLTITNEFVSSFLNKTIKVNSYHYNIITLDTLGAGLEYFAISDDKTIEGFFHKKYPVMAVMWHPERDPSISNEKLLRKVFVDKSFWNNLL